MDINNRADCLTLLQRIHETLRDKDSKLSARIDKISRKPSRLRKNDAYIFQKLCLAILSSNTTWDDIVESKVEIGHALLDWNVGGVAKLSDLDISGLYKDKIAPLNIRTGDTPKEAERKLLWIRDDA